MKKLISILLLVCLLVVPVLASCNDGGEASDTSGEVSDAEKKTEFPLEKRYFDGTVITVLTVESARHIYGELQFVANEEMTGSVINDVVAERNNHIEELYGLKIEVLSERDPATKIEDMLATGLDTYDVIVDSVYGMVPKITSGAFLKLDDLLLLENEWWDKSSIKFLSAAGDTYVVASDTLIGDEMYTYLVMFNKDMYSDSGMEAEYGTMYSLVDEGKWTYDIMHTIAKAVSQPDVDGKWTNTNCTYGFLGDSYGATMMVGGSGIGTVELDEEEMFRFTVDTQKSFDVFNKVYAVMGDPQAAIYVEQIEEAWAGIRGMFQDGKGLYYLTHAENVANFMRMADGEKNVVFGVVPVPKYDAEQENYFSGINAYQSEVIAIPATNIDNRDATVYALEALAFYSRYPFSGKSLKEAYYETTLKLQAVESDDDARMLDLIFSNRIYDLGGIYNWGGIVDLHGKALRTGGNLASTWEGMMGKAEADMNATIEAYFDMQ